jgi:CBS domain-containing protein
MEQKLLVRDIMTKNPTTVKAEDSVVYVAKILFEHGYSGVPVVNERGESVGIVTEYDLISKGDALHLPTLINVLGNIDVYKKDSSLVKDDLKRLMILKAKDVMNTDPLTVSDEAAITLLSELFAHHHRVNPIPVVDKNKKLVGVVSRFDLVRFFVDEDTERVVETNRPEVLDRKVDNFIGKFERKFIFVSRQRARLWLVASLLCALVGFFIAFAIILRVATK